jgi:hypothetical protein
MQRVSAELNSLEAKKRNSFMEYQRQLDEISNLHRPSNLILYLFLVGKISQV